MLTINPKTPSSKIECWFLSSSHANSRRHPFKPGPNVLSNSTCRRKSASRRCRVALSIECDSHKKYAARASLGDYDAAATAAGAGDEALLLGMLCISTSPPALLGAVLPGSCPFSLFSLLLLSAESAAGVASESPSAAGLGGAVHRLISHTTPVKLLSVKLPLAHLRQGLPDLSRARRPALMAP